MLFNSVVFAVFLPLVFLVYWGLRTVPRQNAWLVLASAVFYGWWDWRFLSLLYASCVIDFYAAQRIEHERNVQGGRPGRWLALSMTANLGMLGFFKYCNFFVDSARPLLESVGLNPGTLNVVLPVGISFYTFQTMSYTIDVYRGLLKAERSMMNFAAYVSYFPQLVAGPIERAETLMPQLVKERAFPTLDRFRDAAALMMVGFLKKLIIADTLAPYVDAVFGGASRGVTPSGTEALLGTYAFALQIYGDFSGYSDIARGVSRLFGIELMVNFRQPYFSRSITEFWRRWHISLSFWLRDYLYIPLGGNRGGTVATMRNLMTTMLLGGLWHGAAWCFVLWGGLHGLFLAVERVLGMREPSRWSLGKQVIGALITFHLVCLTWIPFRATTFDGMWTVMAGFAGPWPAPALAPLALVVCGALLLALVDVPHLTSAPEEDPPVARRQALWIATIAAFAVALYVVPPVGEASFIYFQF